MNKLLHSIREFVLLLENGIKRFYIAAFFTLIVFGISCFLIYGDNITDDIEKILIRISFVSFLGIFISILTVLFKEKLNSNTKVYNITSAILSFAIPILYFFFILTDVENKYQMATIFGIFIAFMLIIVYFSNKTSNEKFSTHFSYLVKTLFTSSIISFLVMLGLFLCTSAVYFLIYEFNEPYKIYYIIASFCWLVLFINLFLAMLPKD